MRRQVFEYVELDYNEQRRHSAIGIISPGAFKARMIA
ncbi:IS3 family transposase [Vreelandella aquamarina]